MRLEGSAEGASWARTTVALDLTSMAPAGGARWRPLHRRRSKTTMNARNRSIPQEIDPLC
jgi:hypothetical protein